MKKKSIYILVIVLVASGLIGAGWYYKYNYIDTVTSYIRINYIPPTEKVFYDSYDDISKMVSDKYSKPSVEFSFVYYENDSIAYATTRKQCEHLHNGIQKDIQKLHPNFTPDMDDMKRLMEVKKYEAKVQAYTELLNQHTILLSFTHPRSFDNKKFLKDMKSIGFDKNKIDSYIKKNNISFKWIDVY